MNGSVWPNGPQKYQKTIYKKLKTQYFLHITKNTQRIMHRNVCYHVGNRIQCCLGEWNHRIHRSQGTSMPSCSGRSRDSLASSAPSSCLRCFIRQYKNFSHLFRFLKLDFSKVNRLISRNPAMTTNLPHSRSHSISWDSSRGYGASGSSGLESAFHLGASSATTKLC